MNQTVVRIAARSLLGLMLAIAAAVVAVSLVDSSIASPQQPVREYLAALQRGQLQPACPFYHVTNTGSFRHRVVPAPCLS